MQTGHDRMDKWGSRALGLVPLVVALALGVLVLPRAVAPEEVPLPVVDVRALASVRSVDRALAEKAHRELLPISVRALGSAIREFNTRQARDADLESLGEARRVLDEALPAAVDENSVESLVALRATQLEAFVVEVRAFEASGVESPEMSALAGPFVRRMRLAGWCVNHTILLPEDALRVAYKILLPEDALRVAYKMTWNALLGLDSRPELAPRLDELRALYAFYLRHPHASEGARDRIEAARRTARTPESCAALDAGEQIAAEGWRIEKIRKLSAIDPTYPGPFALGVAQFRMGSYEASAESFRDWLRGHPDGPYTLRARNHLRSAIVEAGL